MTSIRGRGRGGGGGPGGNARGGGPGSNGVRGAWRGGNPVSNMSTPRGGSPAGSNASPAPGAGPRQSIKDHMNDLGKVSADKAKPPPKAFATDTDISGTSSPGSQRELKPWVPDGPEATPVNGSRSNGGGNKDNETFGMPSGGANIPWDQFETNARLFGTKTSYQEEIYTTKLNRSGPDYKKREKEADRLASEILGQTSGNVHVAEERNQASADDAAKGEEERYSGVQRAANAYVPPGARRGPGSAPATAPRPSAPAQIPVSAPPAKANGTITIPAGAKLPSTPTMNATLPPNPMTSYKSAASQPAIPTTSTVPDRRISDIPQAGEKIALTTKQSVSPQPQPSAPAMEQTSTMPLDKTENQPRATVVDQFRQFMGTEREKVEAKKQSIIKLDRDRTIAELKKFQSSFKVPLPMPKDIIPLLAKDEEKQKTIEAQAAANLQAAKSPKPPGTSPGKSAGTPTSGRKIKMSIPEIPPFKPKQSPAAPKVTITEGAHKDIPLATSPTPSAASHASGGAQAKLNPNANSFVFKPNPSAAAFKPGQPSSSLSPASVPAQVPSPQSQAGSQAGPSGTSPGYKNPFFRDQPLPPKGINPRDDFNPWKHGSPVNAASSIHPQWPYTGRKYNSGFLSHPMQPMSLGGFDDDPNSPPSQPQIPMSGMPSNFNPYVRYQPGMPPPHMQNQMQSNPMFSPGGAGYSQLPGGPMHSPQHLPAGAGVGHQNGIPIYFQNGVQIPQNASHFMSPQQHMGYHAGTPIRQGGPHGPGGPGMYYNSQMPTPQQTPQMHHNALQPPPQSQYQASPIPPPQIPQPAYEGGPGH